MLDRPVHIQQYRELNVVMSFVRLASTKASSLWRYIFMTKFDKTENCGIICRGYAVVWKWRQGIKYLDMKAKTFWKFSKCILFQSSTFHLKIEVVTFWDICMTSVDTRSWLTNICRRVSRLTAPRLGKSFFQNGRDGMSYVVLNCTWRRAGREWCCWRSCRTLAQVLGRAEQASPEKRTRLADRRTSNHSPPCKWWGQWRGFGTWAWWKRRPHCWAARFQVYTSLQNWICVWGGMAR